MTDDSDVETGENPRVAHRWKKVGPPRVLHRVSHFYRLTPLSRPQVAIRFFPRKYVNKHEYTRVSGDRPEYEARDCNKFRLYVRKGFVARDCRVLPANLQILAARRVPV